MPELLDAILGAGLDGNQRVAQRGVPLLHWAAVMGATGAVEVLLAHAADLEVRAFGDETPLLCACSKGYASVALQLLEAGANPRVVSATGHSPLWYAVTFDDVPLARALLAKGAELTEEINQLASTRSPEIQGLLKEARTSPPGLG
jgi:ankyrin repeat protein